MSSKGQVVFSTEMKSWDAEDPRSPGHGETWKAEVALDGSESNLTVFLTDAHGRRQEINIEIDGRQVGIRANTDVHHDAPLLAAKLGQNEAYVYETLSTSDTDTIIKIDANGMSRADSMEFTEVSAASAKRQTGVRHKLPGAQLVETENGYDLVSPSSGIRVSVDETSASPAFKMSVPAAPGSDGYDFGTDDWIDLSVAYADAWLRWAITHVGTGFHIDTPASDYVPPLDEPLRSELDPMIDFAHRYLNDPYEVAMDAAEKAGLWGEQKPAP